MRSLSTALAVFALTVAFHGFALAGNAWAAADAQAEHAVGHREAVSGDRDGPDRPDLSEAEARAEAAHLRAQREVERQLERGPLHDRDLIPLRAGLLLLGALAFSMRRWPRFGDNAGLQRARSFLLVFAAFASVGAYYHLFLGDFKHDFDSTDVFHYYVGSKYADELGYFALYECSLVAVDERGVGRFRPRQHARDLRTMQLERVSTMIDDAHDCPERFDPERWAAFGDDVTWFHERWSPELRRGVFKDFGYHPSPVWNAIGSALSNAAPIESDFARSVLLNFDRLLLGAGFASVGLAFGWEIACLVLLAWGTGFLWRYGFVGDGFLRHAWWAGLFVGVSAMKLGRPAGAGALMTIAAALRVFPGAAAFGVVARAALEVGRERRVPPAFTRFAAGAGVCGLLLLSMSVLLDARGFGAYTEFLEKIGTFSGLGATNRIGLSVVTTWLFGATPWLSAALRGSVALAAIALFVMALGRAHDFEAALLGLVLVPFVTDPTNYYYAFVPLFFVLGERRPAITAIVFGACLAWLLNGWLYYRTYEEYFHASVIAVIACGALLVLMVRAPAPDDA